MEKSRDWKGYIDVTAIPTRDLVAKAFDLSPVKGLNLRGPALSAAELDEIETYFSASSRMALDVVRNRAVKLLIWIDPNTGKRFIRPYWLEHSPEDLSDLLKECGMADPEEAVKRALRAQAERNAEPDEEDNSL